MEVNQCTEYNRSTDTTHTWICLPSLPLLLSNSPCVACTYSQRRLGTSQPLCGIVNPKTWILWYQRITSLYVESLIQKLEYYGIRGLPGDWFHSYLASRFQFVSIENTNFSSKVDHLWHSAGVGFGTIAISTIY